MTPARPAAVVVLAAGGGTRMKSVVPKVLHSIGGRTLIGHVLAAVRGLDAERVAVVVGHGRDQVSTHVGSLDPDAILVVQEEQRGTGHATRIALDALGEFDGVVLVTYGDVPLQTTDQLARLLQSHLTSGDAATILAARVPDPTGYGRIIRGRDGQVARIVEEKDATAGERVIAEVNSGIVAFEAKILRDALGRVRDDNAAGEYYLTDVISIINDDGRRVGGFVTDDVWQTEGVNTRAQLAALGKELNRRTLAVWMSEGVEVVDPDTTWVDVSVTLAADVSLKPGTQLHGTTHVGRGAQIGPDTTLIDVQVGHGAVVTRTHGSDAVLGADVTVGPFAYLRPGTVLGDGGKIGTFVETKNAHLARGAKVPHLSYVGDATIGEDTNIGAGTIFANFDGVAKHRTVIGSHVRTGSDNTFVAPVVVGDGAATGAGTVIREDVPAGALAVSMGPQRHIRDWVLKKRAGTPAAEAALLAQAQGVGLAPADPANDRTEVGR